MAKAIYWMRNDLRLGSNPLLQRALTENQALVCVYIHDPRQFARTAISVPRLGWHRRRFLAQTLQQLQDDLHKVQIELLQLWGEPELILPQLVEELGADTLYFSRECAPEERSVESFTCARLEPSRTRVIRAWTGFLINPDKLPFAIEETPDVFSDFRRRVEKVGLENLVLRAPEIDFSVSKNSRQLTTAGTLAYRTVQKHLQKISSQAAWFEILPEESALLQAVEQVQGPREKMNLLCGGERQGQTRVDDYIFNKRSIATYFETRNGLLGLNDSTLFSAWLANGSLAPGWIYERVKSYEKQFGSSKSSEWVVVELLWRDFFKLMLLKYDVKFFLRQGIHGEIRTRKIDRRDVNERLNQILTASTAQPFVNANMRELVQTGFMSNRGRQNVASFMINDLEIPWTLGAWCFESLLIDYDPASNWGNWAYLAGVGNDPRGSRVFNIEKQQSMYDPDGLYVQAWS